MILLVSGGRDFDDLDKLKATLDDVVGSESFGNITLVNGGCRGADQLSTQWAKERGIKYVTMPAKWDEEGPAAGPLRNQRMIDQWRPDVAVVFPGGNGTADCLKRLFFAGVKTLVVGR